MKPRVLILIALFAASAAPASAETASNALSNNALSNNALSNNSIAANVVATETTPSSDAGPGSVSDVIEVQLPGGDVITK